MSFFKDLTGGNPFATQVGQLVDQATDGSQASENWGLLMEICDIINETEDGPKDAVKAIKKKLNMSVGKNYTTVMYTLTVLETCVKNCGKRFHAQIASKDFMGEMVKVIGPKNDPPQVVQEKVLSLLQTWADAFSGQPELKEVCKVYMELKNKGIEFPMTDLDAMAPIHTPARTTNDPDPAMMSQSPQRVPSARQAPTAYAHQPPTLPPAATVVPVPATLAHQPLPPGQPAAAILPPQYPPQQQPQQQQQQPDPNTGPLHLTPEQLAKLKSELDVVQTNCKLLSEMLTELTPGAEEPADMELRQDLNRTCRQMQQRIVDILTRVQNEDVTCELLRVNDELNNVFLRYDRFERLRGNAPATNTTAVPAAAQHTQPPAGSLPAPGEPAVANLIDLATPSPAAVTDVQDPFSTPDPTAAATTGMAGLNVAGQPADQDDDFDMFAQSRQSFDQSKAAIPSYNHQTTDVHQGGLGTAVSAKNTGNPTFGKERNMFIPQDAPTEYDEMADWLKANPKQGGEGAPTESATSSEFDRFLQERAREADTLPDIDAATGASRPRPGRQIQKDDPSDNALFAL